MSMRPVQERYLRRAEGFPLGPPTDKEKEDAAKVLAEAPTYGQINTIFQNIANDFGITPRQTLASALAPLIEEARLIQQESR